MKDITIKLSYVKSTKGTHVFANQESAIPQLYIKKDAFGEVVPKTITLTVKEAK